MSFTPLVSYEGANSGRGLSPGLWAKQPRDFQDLSVGFGFIDDFLVYNEQTKWVHTDAGSSATIALDPAAKGGVALLDSVAGGDNQGLQIQYGGTAGAATFQASANAKIYFEARYKIVDCGGATPDDINFVLGLASVDTTILNSGANSANDAVVIQHIDDSTNYQLASIKDGASAVTSTAIGTIVDGTYIKAGFVIDGVSKVTPFINGVAKTAVTSGIPTDAMAVSVVAHGTSAVDPIVHLDWIACYQEEQIDN